MKFIDDFSTVWRKAWSVRLLLLASVLAGCEAILPIFQPEQPSPWWSVLTFAVVAGALWARFIAQHGMHEDKGDGEQ